MQNSLRRSGTTLPTRTAPPAEKCVCQDLDSVATMKNIILEMRGITKTFPGVKALDNVNLTVREGDIHALCGENGAGKSTLMKVLSGVYPAGSYEGQIFYEGQERHFRDIAHSEQIRHNHYPSGAGTHAASFDLRKYLSRQ